MKSLRHQERELTLMSMSHTLSSALVAILSTGLLAGSVRPAAAQPTNARGFITVNGGLQPSTSTFSDSMVFTESGGTYGDLVSGAAARERATLDSTYRVDSGTLFDVSGGVRLWRNLGVGAAVTRYALDVTAEFSAQVPHPFHFRRDRSISSTLPLSREETAVHVQVLAVVPASSSFTVTAFGGPTFFSLKQGLGNDVRFTHSYPYDGATYADAVTGVQSASRIGFNVGADVAYYFTSNVGVGWLARYSRATIGLSSANNDTLMVEAGGIHMAGGLRLRF